MLNDLKAPFPWFGGKSLCASEVWAALGDVQLSAQVREWCIAHQDNPRYRIVLAGYEGEHDLPGWDKVSWNARAAYKTHKGDTNGNRKLERLWLSPQCQQAPASVQLGLFE